MQHLRDTYTKSFSLFVINSSLTRCPVFFLTHSLGSLLFDKSWASAGSFLSRDHWFSLQPDLLGYAFGNSENEIFLPSLLSPEGIQVHRSSEVFPFIFWQWILSMEPDSPSGQVLLWERERQFWSCVNSFKPPGFRLVRDIFRTGML